MRRRAGTRPSSPSDGDQDAAERRARDVGRCCRRRSRSRSRRRARSSPTRRGISACSSPATPSEKIDDRERREHVERPDPRLRRASALTAKQRGDDGQRDLGDEQEPAPVDRVGDRAADDRQRQQRDELAEREQADLEGRVRQLVDLERRRRRPRSRCRTSRSSGRRRGAGRPGARAAARGRSPAARTQPPGSRISDGFQPSVLEELLGVVRARGRLEQAARAAAEVGQVDACRSATARRGAARGRAPRRGSACRAPASWPMSARIVRSVREATIGSRTPSTQTSVRRPCPRRSSPDRLDRVDLVGARVLAEAEEDHPVAVCHGGIIAARPGVPAGHARARPRPPPNRVGLTTRRPRRRR